MRGHGRGVEHRPFVRERRDGDRLMTYLHRLAALRFATRDLIDAKALLDDLA